MIVIKCALMIWLRAWVAKKPNATKLIRVRAWIAKDPNATKLMLPAILAASDF